MEADRADGVTRLLQRWCEGDEEAASRVYALVYDELHRIASRLFRRERPDHTLQTTAVIHEAYLRLDPQENIEWQNRAHFLGLMARVMRRVLVDHARERSRIKRGGGSDKVTIDEAEALDRQRPPDVLALDDALRDLERLDPDKAAVVELRFFGGLTIEETADCLGISPVTVARQWRRARAWLYRELCAEAPGDA